MLVIAIVGNLGLRPNPAFGLSTLLRHPVLLGGRVSRRLTSSRIICDAHSLSFTSSVLCVDWRLYLVRETGQRS